MKQTSLMRIGRKISEDSYNSAVDHAKQFSRAGSYLAKHIGNPNNEVSLRLHPLAFLMAKL